MCVSNVTFSYKPWKNITCKRFFTEKTYIVIYLEIYSKTLEEPFSPHNEGIHQEIQVAKLSTLL